MKTGDKVRVKDEFGQYSNGVHTYLAKVGNKHWAINEIGRASVWDSAEPAITVEPYTPETWPKGDVRVWNKDWEEESWSTIIGIDAKNGTAHYVAGGVSFETLAADYKMSVDGGRSWDDCVIFAQ